MRTYSIASQYGFEEVENKGDGPEETDGEDNWWVQSVRRGNLTIERERGAHVLQMHTVEVEPPVVRILPLRFDPGCTSCSQTRSK
jgi:hypothetical protein